MVEILDGDASARLTFVTPIIQFQVDDLATARQEMEKKGLNSSAPLITVKEKVGYIFERPMVMCI
jgi:hypothetical protein